MSFYFGGSCCTIPFSKVDNGEIDFQELYGIDAKNPSLNLINANDITDEVVCFDSPFVIGADPGGNPFIINCSGNDGSVYYWDRTHLHDDNIVIITTLVKRAVHIKRLKTLVSSIMKNVGGDNSLIKEQF